MPFKFSLICQLLEDLEKTECRDPPLLQARKQEMTRKNIVDWFTKHRMALEARDINRVAVLSTLFPERRTDRVYGMQSKRLEKVVCRCLRLNKTKTARLSKWKESGNGDLGACAERVQRDVDASLGHAIVTVDEIDTALQQMASQCKFSSLEVQAQGASESALELLERIFIRLRSWEIKWLIRLILKDFSPVILDVNLVLREFHFLLPELLKFQDNFNAAITLLRGPLSHFHSKPDLRSQRLFREEAAKIIHPAVGVKVGRPTFRKAWSWKNCFDMVNNQNWIVEWKYDGEYCEIHVDLANKENELRIFSKSGKDSTIDRKALHKTIRDSLRIGCSDCRFQRKCIVLGELVVYSDKEEKILEFHKIRKHVYRSGTLIGANQDSQAHDYEHLMIIFFDVLLIDDDIVMRRPLTERRDVLRGLVKEEAGRAIRSDWKKFDFSTANSKNHLLQLFAISQYHQYEGLILKPADSPYFTLQTKESSGHPNFFVKVKKDYMIDMGGDRDVADFAIVGASYDAQQALKSGLKNIRWTNFHIGCLTNKEAVRFGAKPVFKIVAIIKQESCISKQDLQFLNDHGQFRTVSYERGCVLKEFEIIQSYGYDAPMTVAFGQPFVVEILGSGFDKPQNEKFFMLRHPRIKKIHLDRSWQDTVCLEELNRLADEARKVPADSKQLDITTQKVAKYIAKCERIYSASQQTTQESSSSPATHESLGDSESGGRPAAQPIFIRVDTEKPMALSKQTGQFPILPIPSLDEAFLQPLRKRGCETPALVAPAKRVKLRTPLKDSQTNAQVGIYEFDMERKVVEFYPKNPYGLS
ncbi:hypothetical protein AOQ84DRAFT_305094 [Glonium stellatum]|uniref:ATP-dependent DNA ligase family profile domain-containing protein n=1 Tax=Glonium stellatum TaxID=574774 RepID=A0A8E2EPZ2_9PEZI|nr:hypothetical protein AOQ84DRAFT_305094 [Glonium stellatum]